MPVTQEHTGQTPPDHDLLSTAHGAETGRSVESRVVAYDWPALAHHLDANGWAMLDGILSAEACRTIASLYEGDGRFRQHIVMARHGFGRGEYKYFAYPLPDRITELRTSLYRRLAPIADGWNEALGIDVRYPAEHRDFLARCHAAGQTRPTPYTIGRWRGNAACTA